MPLPDSIAELVERFEANRKEYYKGHYNKTQTRVDYVNPLFAALGWDMATGMACPNCSVQWFTKTPSKSVARRRPRIIVSAPPEHASFL